MFIAVIQENFDVTEDEKRVQQIKAFLQQKELGGSSQGFVSSALATMVAYYKQDSFSINYLQIRAGQQAEGPLGLWTCYDGDASQRRDCKGFS